MEQWSDYIKKQVEYQYNRLQPANAELEDLQQQVLMEALEYLAEGHFNKSYVASFVHGRFVNALRRKNAEDRRNATGYDDETTYPDPTSILLEEEDEEYIWSTIADTLTPQQSRVVYLTYWLGLSNEETAHEMGLAVGTVKATLSQCRKKLKEEFHDRESAEARISA